MTGNKRNHCRCEDEVLKFLDEIAKVEGEPYATRFVRTLAGCDVRDEEDGILELPPSYSKRKLYERFCFEHGWIARANAKGNYKEWRNYPERVHDDHLGDMASWPQSSYPQIICSWGSF